ncbi:ParA family protein [Microbacterium sp. 2FI]|uniref:MinD/ParA family ATP-binding protein n=1 Tax=Microbacterium sp. 2FI TaxID=2502193 RepID=UPI0010FA2B6D|nr:ParA family protein [Microbacterium sp. 2FI]
MNGATTLRMYATVTGDTARFVASDGKIELVIADGHEDIRTTVLRRATEEARRAAAPLELIATGDRGDHQLIVHADGTLLPLETPIAAAEAAKAFSEGTVEPPASTTRRLAEHAPTNRRHAADAEAPARAKRVSFIEADEGAGAYAPAGLRRILYRAGLVNGPSKSEAERMERERIVARQWAGCRTIAVANGKGGVGKTMTTAMLAAVYARFGGGNVLAWDNNDTRGTLGWRTEQGLYDTTIRDLLPAAERLLAPTASISDIARFVHHQPADRYDVLRSNPELLAAHQRLAQADFDRLMQVAARYYRLVVFDSGNDESADRWLRMVDSSYQLVLPTLAAPESAESAVLLLEALRERDERSAALAANAVVIVTQAEPANRPQVARTADGFEGLVRAVETIPFDPALKSGPLRFDALRPATQRAWIKAAASTVAAL